MRHQRSIGDETGFDTRALKRFGALLREAFPKSRRFDLGRELGITITVSEWALLIRALGERPNRRGALELQAGVHSALLEGQLPAGGARRRFDLQHALPGIWAAFRSNFIRAEGKAAERALEHLGPRAERGTAS
ncbi:MAG: hypothetical protein AAFQ65_04125 [Myxococcota bacterium]